MIEVVEKTDSELVSLTLKDSEAFLFLVERYEEKLLRYVRRFAGLGRQCAEDVVQEVFLKTYRNLNDFDQSLSFSSWIYRIAHNEAVNYLKKLSGKQTVGLEGDDENVVSLIDVLASDIDLVKTLKKKEIVKMVQNVLSGMSEKYREILVLKFLEEKDYLEISDILKKPMGTVATLINRAKAQFRKVAEALDINNLKS